MIWYDTFLTELEPITWRPKPGDGLPASIEAGQVFVQATQYGLEVAVAAATSRPTSADMRRAWKARQANRPSPVLLAVGYPGGGGTLVAVCGPVGDEPPVTHSLEPSRVERLAATALAEPSRHAAARCLLRLLPEVESDLPGIINSGLLATQEMRAGVPQRNDWSAATTTGRASLKRRGKDLVKALGFAVDQLGANTSVLTAGRDRRAIAVFLDEGETFEVPVPRFDGVSPVAHALAVADREHLPWVVMTRASEIRLYAARPDTGVGRKGRTETFVEVNLALLPDDRAGYLHLLFSADALAPAGTLEQILAASADFAADLASRLRDRVYREAVPVLARAVAQRLDPDPDEETLAQAYDQTLNILFRLLFVAYGEDKGLLPYNSNDRYRDHSLKRLARLLSDDINAGRLVYDAAQTDLWGDVVQIWEAIDRGNRGWGVPAYNGGLFSSAPEVNAAGAALAGLRLDNSEFGPALAALLVDTGDAQVVGPVDFRSLSVREFGTIYEGLLESALSVAPTDLTVDAKGNFVPARAREHVEVPAGAVYLHNQSGARKATGSYFTKPFAVEHLLDHALEPALDEHLARIRQHLDEGDEAAAAGAFFDFRCADIAMGSAHFLVAAVDRIEAKLSAFLALNPIPAVTVELETLATAAYEALGELKDGVEIETTSLLRRQVGRRCIYGVDRNPIAVELARLAIWIHTFVPGLPLSFLDHNLVVGDSLTGIATVDEALAELTGGNTDAPQTLFHDRIVEFLARASKALRRLGTISDATVADVKEARQAHLEALDQVKPAKALFDLLVAHRLGKAPLPVDVDEDTVARAAVVTDAAAAAAEARPLHFPVAFPEVFLRDRPGFDCLLGNPPWEEATVEELGFWALRFPGLKSLTATQQKSEIKKLRAMRSDLVVEYERELAGAETTRRLLIKGPFPGMGTGDPDLYKAFAWRFEVLNAPTGRLGIVLPRSIFAAKGSAPWRTRVLSTGRLHVVFAKNKNEWLFTDVNPGYGIGLVDFAAGTEVALVVHGTYQSEQDMTEGLKREGASIPLTALSESDPALCIPALDGDAQVNLFSRLLAQPAFGRRDREDFEARPHTEFHATNDASEFFTGDARDHPVYNHVNIGHFRFEPENGPFEHAKWHYAIRQLEARRRSGRTRVSSPFSVMPSDWHNDPSQTPALRPRIAFRDVVHASNARKVWAALLPSRTLLTNKAPYLLFARGDLRAQALLLALLGSSVVDWYGHARVNLNLNYFILNTIPMPEIDARSPRGDRLVGLSAGLALREDGDYGEWRDLADPLLGGDREPATAELDAIVSLEFGLDEEVLPTIWNEREFLRPKLTEVREWRRAWRS